MAEERVDPRPICMRVIIGGLVQGVSFRASLRDVARSCRVNGWVRNRPDGSVEAVLQGREEDVNSVLKWARHGPRGAQVESVTAMKQELSKTLTDFQIVR